MSNKGSNGADDGKENLKKVEVWIYERNQHRDWSEYEERGKIHRGKLAEELGFGRSVCNQNPGVKELLLKFDKIWFGTELVTKDAQIAAQEASIERTRGKLQASTGENNKHLVRIAELEAEVRRLEKQVKSYEALHGLIETGAPGCRI